MSAMNSTVQRAPAAEREHFGRAEPVEKRALWPAMRRGALGRCPNCGQGRLFSSFLKVADRCESCGAEYHHHRADDLPAYIVIVIVGHIVVGGLLSVESHSEWPIWIHAVVWPLLTVALTLLLLPRVKGAIVGLQWALRMHGFAEHPDGDDNPALRPRADPGQGE
jgi:uncharacterized protein (DUF983 family)